MRLLVNRMRSKNTILEVELLGVPLRLAVEARQEIRRARSISTEAALVERMLESLSPGDVIYDVGANIGLIGLLLARHPRGIDTRVHCFEPEPKNFGQLERNVQENGLASRVFPHRVALAERGGELDLFVRGGPGEGRHSTVAAKGSTRSIRISAETASAFAASIGEPPDLVKIDVEGAEGRVLSGMADLLRDHRAREIFMELHPKGDRDRMPDGTPIQTWLGERGYELAWETERGHARHCHYR